MIPLIIRNIQRNKEKKVGMAQTKVIQSSMGALNNLSPAFPTFPLSSSFLISSLITSKSTANSLLQFVVGHLCLVMLILLNSVHSAHSQAARACSSPLIQQDLAHFSHYQHHLGFFFFCLTVNLLEFKSSVAVKCT